jgi:hypothetical protein
MRGRLSVAIQILLVVAVLVLLVVSNKGHGIIMASIYAVLKVTHLDMVVVLFGAIYYFVKDVLPHIWPVVVIVVVGSALIVVARRRTGPGLQADRRTLLNQRSLEKDSTGPQNVKPSDWRQSE